MSLSLSLNILAAVGFASHKKINENVLIPNISNSQAFFVIAFSERDGSFFKWAYLSSLPCLQKKGENAYSTDGYDYFVV